MRRSPSRPGPENRPHPPLEVAHAGTVYRVAVKRVGTARRFTLRVRPATQDAVLTMPSRASLRSAKAFAERHAEWIGVRLRALPSRIPLKEGTVVPLRGVEHRIVYEPRALRRRLVVADREPGSGTSPHLRVTGAASEIGALLMGFLRREARRDLEEAARRHAAAAHVTFDRISLRDTRSRWGSCSSCGTLSFCWRLVMAPPFVLDYLAAHEVAHLRHMDHSTAFWELAERLAPRIWEAEAWLKAHGPALHLYTE